MKIEYIDVEFISGCEIVQGNVYLLTKNSERFIGIAARCETNAVNLILLDDGNRIFDPVANFTALRDLILGRGYNVKDITDRCKFVCDAAFKPTEQCRVA